MLSVKKKVIISACLLGEYCRYDGKTKQINEVLEAFKDYNIIPFCPEAPLFGTPRERIGIVKIDGENRILQERSKEDVTQVLRDQINSFIEQNKEVGHIVLKSKSPSCGQGTTPIFNPINNTTSLGNGIAADIFLKHYVGCVIEDEKDYI